MAGEDAHDTGRDGLQRAKTWLELSTRVEYAWTYQDRPLGELVHFSWPHASRTPFSFDFGGRFQGDHLDGETFVAEVKKYRREGDLPARFRDFLAKCYVALDTKPERCDNFLWISWSPFQARLWDHHATPENVRKSIIQPSNRKRVLGTDNESQAAAKLNADLAAQVARRVWLVTLSEQQEQLVLTESHYREVAKLISHEQRFRA
jgi:hypothetical protein